MEVEQVDEEFKNKSLALMSTLKNINKRIAILRKLEESGVGIEEVTNAKVQMLYLMNCVAWIKWRSNGSEPSTAARVLKEQLDRCKKLMATRNRIIETKNRNRIDTAAAKRFISRGIGHKLPRSS